MRNSDPLDWLLEEDRQNPGVRTFALTELLDRPADDPEVIAARRAVMTSGPVPAILDAQDADGFWVKPGSGYSPKSGRSSSWPNWGPTPAMSRCVAAASTS